MCDDDGKCTFQFTWAIENCPLLYIPYLVESPTVHADSLLNTKWHLNISCNDQKRVMYAIYRDMSSHIDPVTVIFEISFLDPDGLPLVSIKLREEFYIGSFFEFTLIEDAFRKERARFIVNDTLTIRLRLWKVSSYTSNYSINQCFAHTRLKIERRTVFWCIKNFSNIDIAGTEAYYKLPHLSETGNYVLTLKLNLMKIDYIDYVMLIILNDNVLQSHSIEISVLDTKGKKHFFTRTTIVKNTQPTLFGIVTKSDLMAQKESFLENDVLCLRCEFEIESGPPVNNPQEYTRQIFFL